MKWVGGRSIYGNVWYTWSVGRWNKYIRICLLPLKWSVDRDLPGFVPGFEQKFIWKEKP